MAEWRQHINLSMLFTWLIHLIKERRIVRLTVPINNPIRFLSFPKFKIYFQVIEGQIQYSTNGFWVTVNETALMDLFGELIPNAGVVEKSEVKTGNGKKPALMVIYKIHQKMWDYRMKSGKNG